MMELSQSFYTSIGLPNLPQSFWDYSMITRPEVRCGAVRGVVLGVDQPATRL